MKKLTPVVLLCFCLTALAQNVGLRVVQGKTYNPARSKLWRNYWVKVMERKKNLAGVVVLDVDNLPTGPRLVITNCPEDAAIDKIMQVRCMKVGITEKGFELWDCGEPVK